MRRSIFPKTENCFIFFEYYNNKQCEPFMSDCVARITYHYDEEVSAWFNHYQKLADFYVKKFDDDDLYRIKVTVRKCSKL